MLKWGDCAAAAPGAAGIGRALRCQVGVGLGLRGTCLTTTTTGHGDWNPQHSVWDA